MKIISGYRIHGEFPSVVKADEVFWTRYLFRNLERVAKLLAVIPREAKCLVCGDFSLNFTSRSSLKAHLLKHSRITVQFWLKNFVSKSSEEIESIMEESGNKEGIDEL